MNKIVIDANVWIRFARAKDISPLLDRMVTYKLLPVVNNYLLTEIFDAVIVHKWMNENQARQLMSFIRRVSLVVTENAVFGISPDPKDNYLFDLAVQNNCVFIITDDYALLNFSLKPIAIHTTNWFLKQFSIAG